MSDNILKALSVPAVIFGPNNKPNWIVRLWLLGFFGEGLHGRRNALRFSDDMFGPLGGES